VPKLVILSKENPTEVKISNAKQLIMKAETTTEAVEEIMKQLI
jgi:hypothetical protein